MARDPRVEPRAGDVVAAYSAIFTITSVAADGFIEFTRRGSGKYSSEPGELPLSQWKHEFATATIIHAEGE